MDWRAATIARRMSQTPADPAPRPRSALAGVALFLIVCAIGLAADLFTKHLAFDRESTKLADAVVRDNGRWIALGADARGKVVIPRLLDFHATVNEGAVFGLGQGQRVWFVVVSVAAIAFLIYLVTRTRSRFEIVLLAGLLAGVLGNMYDRITYGYVRDMILALPGVQWPGAWQLPMTIYPGRDRLVFPYIFNVADCLLVCGVGVLLIRSFFVAEKKESRRDEEAKVREA